MRTLNALYCGAMLLGLGACTTYRILRHREPDARNLTMFPVRTVHKAPAPYEFARARELRHDLDTVTVRAAGGDRMPFRRYLEQHAVLAFLVIRNDTVLYETYRGGYSADRVHVSFSMSKSVLSALIGIALAEGKIRSLDQPVTDYLPELASKPAFAGVTLRHLIEMKSGLRHTETGSGPWSDLRSDEARVYYTTDLPHFIANSRREVEPGTQWKYKDTDAELLGWILTRATGQDIASYTEQKLWTQIGAEHDATWSLDHRNGLERVSSGFNATARDFARFARLYLEGGAWNGKQIVPAEWVARSGAPDATRSEPEVSTWWQMQHTLYWWHAIQPPAGDFYADGSRGQRVYVDPATRTIIVQFANDSRQDFPFRKIVAYLSNKSWDYPRSIPALLNRAAGVSADSIRPTFERLIAERKRDPERYVVTENAMHTLGTLLMREPGTLASAVVVLTLLTEHYPRSARGFAALSDAYRALGDTASAARAGRRAAELRGSQ